MAIDSDSSNGQGCLISFVLDMNFDCSAFIG